MLLRVHTLEGIRDGSVSVVYRRWKRPTVREGGTLLTALGQLEIGTVAPVTMKSISDADARKAGHASRDELIAELKKREGKVYRIEVGPLRADPRVALRNSAPTKSELATIVTKLDRMDARAGDGPWTDTYLQMIAEQPGVRAGDLCEHVGLEKPDFKRNVRKLKALGLTESLKVGYRLSTRGRAVLAHRGGAEM